MKKNLFSLFTCTFIAVTIIACSEKEKTNISGQSFDSAVSLHLRAIASANIEELEPTVGDSVTMISPFGDLFTSKDEFMNLHKAWFTQKNWEWSYNILKREYLDSLGYTLLQYRYTEKDSVGNITRASDNYLVLIFRNSKEGWKLVHDQNTSIPKKR